MCTCHVFKDFCLVSDAVLKALAQKGIVVSIPPYPRVVTGEKNSPTVAHACRKRRLNWVLSQVGG
jgi:hypothetical protein